MIIMKVAEVDSLDDLAVRSIKQYTEMIDLLGELPKQISNNSPDSMLKFNSTLSFLQIQMQQTDRCLTERHNQSDISDTTRHLLVKRYDLQMNMLKLLKESVPRATSAKSLLASEMQSLRSGRRALNGYKTVSENQGRIINKTS